MKRHWMLAAVAALTVGLVASVAWVQDAPREGGRRGGREGGRRGRMRRSFGGRRGSFGVMLRDYTAGIEGLTADQRKQIADIRKDALAEVKKIEAAMNADIKKLLTPEQVKAMVLAQRRTTNRLELLLPYDGCRGRNIDQGRTFGSRNPFRQDQTAIDRPRKPSHSVGFQGAQLLPEGHLVFGARQITLSSRITN
ncbi:hypothetical protein LCGC14_2880920 [marine sediment metagenome]|uniref:Uncharacterized protein n=1 Tax=marine sediment metagenome TaxID=412755 RepID=A0A0F8Y0D1_9ZZZZ